MQQSQLNQQPPVQPSSGRYQLRGIAGIGVFKRRSQPTVQKQRSSHRHQRQHHQLVTDTDDSLLHTLYSYRYPQPARQQQQQNTDTISWDSTNWRYENAKPQPSNLVSAKRLLPQRECNDNKPPTAVVTNKTRRTKKNGRRLRSISAASDTRENQQQTTTDSPKSNLELRASVSQETVCDTANNIQPDTRVQPQAPPPTKDTISVATQPRQTASKSRINTHWTFDEQVQPHPRDSAATLVRKTPSENRILSHWTFDEATAEERRQQQLDNEAAWQQAARERERNAQPPTVRRAKLKTIGATHHRMDQRNAATNTRYIFFSVNNFPHLRENYFVNSRTQCVHEVAIQTDATPSTTTLHHRASSYSSPFNKLHRPLSHNAIQHLHRSQSTQPSRLSAKSPSDLNFQYSISRNSSSLQLKNTNRIVVLSNQHGSDPFSLRRATDCDDTPDDFISFDYDPTAAAAAASTSIVKTLPMWSKTPLTEKYFEVLSKFRTLNMPALPMIKTPSSTTFISVPTEPIPMQESAYGLISEPSSNRPPNHACASESSVGNDDFELCADKAVALMPLADTPNNLRINVKLNQRAERTRMRTLCRNAWAQANARRLLRHEHRNRVVLTVMYGALFMLLFMALAWPLQQCI